MATKANIITNIDAKIITNGNILATDTNAILKDILNCDELNSSNSLDTFQYQGNAAIKQAATVSYSIRGITGLFANITLQIAIKQDNINNLTFPHKNPDLFKSLSSVIKNTQNTIDFLVRIRNESSAEISKKLGISPVVNFRVGSLIFNFDEKNLSVFIESQIQNDNLLAGDSINNSFAIHSN